MACWSSPPPRALARVRDYVVDLKKNNASQTVLARLQELQEAAAVMDSGRDWSWINRIAFRIRAQHKPARPKRSRLVNAGQLLDLGLDLLAQAENENTVRRRAIAYRD